MCESISWDGGAGTSLTKLMEAGPASARSGRALCSFVYAAVAPVERSAGHVSRRRSGWPAVVLKAGVGGGRAVVIPRRAAHRARHLAVAAWRWRC